MKRLFNLLTTILLFVLCLTACAQSAPANGTQQPSSDIQQSGTKEPDTSQKPSDTEAGADNEILVVYFSCTGTTEKIADYIIEKTGGTRYPIQPAVPYTEEDLKYYTNGRADKEQADPTARPEIDGTVENMAKFKTVFIGYPIWHGQAPRIIDTFLESYDFSGKTLIPFCTSHSSGIGSSDKNLHAHAPNAEWKSGRRFASSASKDDVYEWVESMNIKINSVASFDLANGENGNAPAVLLNSGYKIPILGIGTYSLQGETCVNSILAALANGVRLIDTAYMYGNEKEVGQAIRQSGIPRDEIFVITKIYPGEQYTNPEKAIQDALDKLDIDYLDMMLLHHPGANDVKAYKAMEKFVEQGKIRSVGLSNWYVEEIDGFIAQVNIKPALVQNEIHPYYQEKTVVPYMHKLGIVVQAWYPFGGRGHTGAMLSDQTIAEIAKAHNVTAAQVILRWHLQRGVVAIPGSSNPAHIRENISVFGFELSESEMTAIAALDRNEKHDWY